MAVVKVGSENVVAEGAGAYRWLEGMTTIKTGPLAGGWVVTWSQDDLNANVIDVYQQVYTAAGVKRRRNRRQHHDCQCPVRFQRDHARKRRLGRDVARGGTWRQ